MRIGILTAMIAAMAAASGEQHGRRTFDVVLLLEKEGATSASVSIGDVDNDGHPDIVVAKGRHWPLQNMLFRGDGKGHFQGEPIGAAPDRTYSAALADVNGDGTLDLVVSNDRPDAKVLYFNDGKGHFHAAGSFGNPDWPTRYVSLADLNGDRRPDILVANRGGDPSGGKGAPSYVCLNDGQGAFPSCQPLPTESATIIVTADLDGDGFVDLVIPHRDGGQNRLFWNDGTGTFRETAAQVGPAQSWIRAAAAGDLDGDGAPDIVVGDERSGLSLYRNLGKRAFAAPIRFGTKPDSPYSIVVADMNGDGLADIVVGYEKAKGSVFFNLGRDLRFEEVSWGDGKGATYGVAVADLDGDGWQDIAAARSDAPNGVWFSRPAKK